MSDGVELPDPGLMSLTRRVADSVPLLTLNSSPAVASDAAKYTELPRAVNWTLPQIPTEAGVENVCTRTVPAAVPSLFHRAKPPLPSPMVKNSLPPATVRPLGGAYNPNGPG